MVLKKRYIYYLEILNLDVLKLLSSKILEPLQDGEIFEGWEAPSMGDNGLYFPKTKMRRPWHN